MCYKYKMSICMIVRDEEKNLRRCLESIRALISKSYVELVIVDTGSVDGTVDIAKEFTSKVFLHKWNNNFSEMRNISISYAEGQWIFILDADEVLEDSVELLTLISGNVVNDYNTIEIQTRNYYSLTDERSFAYYLSKRIFRNDGSFRYTGAIHNQPVFKEPILSTSIQLKHYGYILEDNELIDKKFLRTSSILKKELKKDPHNIYYIYKLSEAYNMHGDKEKALIEIRRAYSLLKRLPEKVQREHAYIFGNYARIAYGIDNIEESQTVSQEGIKIRPDYIDLYYILAECHLVFNDKERMIENCKKYLELVKDYENTGTKDSKLIMYNTDDNSKSFAYYQIAKYYYDMNKYEESFKYAVCINGIERDDLIIKILLKLNKLKEIESYYELIKNNKALKDVFVKNVQNIKNILNPNARKKIEKLLEQPQTSKDILLEGTKSIKQRIEKLVEDGQLEDAKLCIDEYEKIISKDVDVYSMKAVIALIEGRYLDAEKILLEGLQADDRNFDLYYNLGYLYEQTGDRSQAIRFYTEAQNICDNENMRFRLKSIIEGLANMF